MAGSQLAAATLVAHSHTIVLLGVLIIIIQLFMGVLCQPVNCTGRTNPADVAALQQLYVEWNETYDLQTTLRGWQNDVDPCYDGAWFGVLCDFSTCPTYKVIGLELTGLDLQGQLSHAIGNLTNLQFLTISGNPRLSGNLPNEISNLNNLLKLDLHGNNFTGHIPNFQMEFLQHFGQIADIFNSILGGQNTKKLSLQILDLSSNHLNGIMPKMPPAISQLNISHNQLDGTLDAFLGSLTNISGITTLDISYNNFSGNVSSLFHNLNVGLSVLLMNNNNFNGDFPDLSSTLQILDISNNKFDGSFPTFNTSNCSLSLKYVSMAGNMFAGPLPYELLHCSPMLEVINFNQNNFSGILNVTNINTSHLVGEISLANNSIVGLIPPWESGTYSPVLLGGNPCCNTSQIVTEDDYLLDEVEIFYVNGSLESLLQAYNCRYNLSTITIPGLTNFSPFRPTNDNKVLIWTLSTTLPFFMIMGSIILTITFWKYRANMIILREIQQEFANKEVQPTLYSYNTLKTAARDFHQSNKLGEGGFGIVYKGVLSNGGELAIKLLKKSEQGVTEFLNEIVLLTSVKHKNLVTLKGCCLHGVQRLLVYEFVENQNLAEVLWGDNYLQLDWPRRFNICVGIARGLSYLHEDSHQRIIHRDIKAPNILLDKQFNAKIADFGLARLFPDDETHMTTFHIAGTRGYLAPEYATLGQLSDKVDVYSFGILLLEIISGRKNIDFTLSIDKIYLLEWAWFLHENKMLQNLIDQNLNINSDLESQIHHVINVALLCVHTTPTRRPSMMHVLAMLLGEKEVEVTFQESLSSKKNYSFMSKSSTQSSSANLAVCNTNCSSELPNSNNGLVELETWSILDHT
ncbi:hypothetical protein CY35_07G008400 [Sphagnum magellanicum]|uniref:Uncharacterized protein n=1 Tax=Sphagnum magellanicum TaxID=128215 RepID=A0ACB8HIP7_9BRYO|nr:hypothetical protein CY35_07G008400 [Sphagnum magellanicum]